MNQAPTSDVPTGRAPSRRRRLVTGLLAAPLALAAAAAVVLAAPAGAATVPPTAAPTAAPTPTAAPPTPACPPVVPSVTLRHATRTELALAHTASCGEHVTLHLYRDAAGTQEVGSSWRPARPSSATVVFGNLEPETDHWYRITWAAGPDAPSFAGPLIGPARTTGTLPTPSPAPTWTCPPVLPNVAFSSADPTTLTFDLGFLCGPPVVLRVFADAAGRREVGPGTAVPTGASSRAAAAVTNLTPDTAYWYGLGGQPLAGPVKTELPRRTPTTTPSTTPTTTRTPTPTVTTCAPMAPSVRPVWTTRTEVALRYAVGCGEAVTVSLYRDAAGRQPVAEVARRGGPRGGDVVFAGLTPGTDHWYRVSGTGVQGPVNTSVSDPTPTPTPTGTAVCPAVMPGVQFDSAGDDWIAVGYAFLCTTPVTVHLYGDAAGARQVAAATVRPGPYAAGVVVFTGLTRGTPFWFNLSIGNPPWRSPVTGPARTTGTSVTPTRSPTASPTVTPTGGASCSAVLRVVSRWGDGFSAEVEVRNTGAVPITWSVAWTWTGGQTLAQAWNATVAGSPSGPVLTGAPWNRLLQPGQAATAGLIGRGTTTPVPDVTCTAA